MGRSVFRLCIDGQIRIIERVMVDRSRLNGLIAFVKATNDRSLRDQNEKRKKHGRQRQNGAEPRIDPLLTQNDRAKNQNGFQPQSDRQNIPDHQRFV